MPAEKLKICEKYIFSSLCFFAALLLGACAGNTNERVSAEAEKLTPAYTEKQAPASLTASPKTQKIDFAVNTPVPRKTAEARKAPTFVPATVVPSAAVKKERDVSKKYAVSEGVYTVAWISDTQHYANTFPEIYPTITTFLRDHSEEMNLAYVVHTGDLVHRVGDKANWDRAVEAMSILGDIPYGVLAGNHDEAKKNGIYDNYCRYFGEQLFAEKQWYGESYENNRGHYDLMTIGNTDYVFVYMSFAPDEAALRFIKESFDRFPDRIGILCLHDFIKTDGTLSSDGKLIREKILKDCPNCYLVLCGHRYGFYCLEDSFFDKDRQTERTVYEMMMNYQAAGKEGGSGYFRLMQFDDENGTIQILSYSAYLNDYNWLDDPGNREPRYAMDAASEEFTLKMPWRE